jgi:prepilin-type N-terminal cleavage/methylation domain-containing protein
MKQKNSKNSGFTLLEILLVVAAIGILAGIVIFAINPTRQLAQTRNAQRRVDVTTIINAVHQYAIDNKGVLPATITSSATGVCKSGATSCSGLIDLSVLTANGKYLTSLPADPSNTSTTTTGYLISVDDNGRVTVSAPSAEQSETISVTR